VLEYFNLFKNEISGIFTIKDHVIEKLMTDYKKLDEENIKLKNKVMEYEQENNKGRFCVNCHEMFTQKFNDEVNKNIINSVLEILCISSGKIKILFMSWLWC
jgi:predicted adenine nucleotide alpha hydrolase (AANH) superfamily ATPase